MFRQRMNRHPKPLLSVEETAILLGETRSTLYRAVKARTIPLPAIWISERFRIHRARCTVLVPRLGIRLT
jgi:excisionase family DNA binding protein